jgi:hypothetical protein
MLTNDDAFRKKTKQLVMRQEDHFSSEHVPEEEVERGTLHLIRFSFECRALTMYEILHASLGCYCYGIDR